MPYAAFSSSEGQGHVLASARREEAPKLFGMWRRRKRLGNDSGERVP